MVTPLPIPVTIDGTHMVLRFSVYDNDRLAIQLFKDLEPYATITVNLPNDYLDEGEFFVKTWAENEDITAILKQSDIFIDTGRRVSTGFVQAEVWRFK